MYESRVLLVLSFIDTSLPSTGKSKPSAWPLGVPPLRMLPMESV